MKLNKAITLSLINTDLSAFSEYTIAVAIFRLYLSKQYDGEDIEKITRDYATLPIIRSKIKALVDDGILTEVFKGAYTLTSNNKIQPADIACSVDPFCYVSHLSAMEFHGITDRIPSKLHLTTLPNNRWKEQALAQMEKDLGEEYTSYYSESLPKLTKKLPGSIYKTELLVSKTTGTHTGAYKIIHDRSMRVSTIGRTFLEMIVKPDLCGGIRHVIDVYKEFAPKYLRLIVTEIDRHGKKIDKIRAGYILDEIVHTEHEVIDSWVDLRSRGGSMKLDASAEYHHEYSEKWWISLNLF